MDELELAEKLLESPEGFEVDADLFDVVAMRGEGGKKYMILPKLGARQALAEKYKLRGDGPNRLKDPRDEEHKRGHSGREPRHGKDQRNEPR